MKNKNIRAILMFLASLLVTGLGQVLNGQLKKGIVFYIIVFGLATLAYPLVSHNFTFYLVVMGIAFLVDFSQAIEAFMTSRKISSDQRPRSSILVILGFVFGTMAITYIVRHIGGLSSQPTLYTNSAMSNFPTMYPGDVIFARAPEFKKLQRGDIVAFRYPNDESVIFIKRIVGLPGDKITWRNNELSINDVKVDDKLIGDITSEDESILKKDSEMGNAQKLAPLHFQIFQETIGQVSFQIASAENHPTVDQETIVPEHSVYLVGDLRSHSADSRYFGTVEENKIVGKALYILWTRDRIIDGFSFQRWGKKL